MLRGRRRRVIGIAVVAAVDVAIVAGAPVALRRAHGQSEPTARTATSAPVSARAPFASPRRAPAVRHRVVRVTAAERIRAGAATFSHSLRDGQPVGLISIPRIHLRIAVVEGTTDGDLAKGPGHYDAESGLGTSLPGMGGVIAIAGHRTTHLAPFRHIDDLRPGDRIYLRTAYGSFRYAVYAHRIVAADDWSILRTRPYEKLVLSACHPLHSAAQRWVVFARLEGEAPAQTT